MINQAERKAIRKYFYGTKGPLLLATLGTLVMCFLAGVTHLVFLPFLTLLAAAVWALKEKFIPDINGENQFDAQLSADIEDLRAKALDRLGLVSEQVSMIEPIKARGPYYGYTEIQLNTKRRTWIGALVSLIKNFRKYSPSLIFRYGSDEETRYSMVEVNLFIFSENQIFTYTCGYDICSGEIYEEKTSEFFYQDIDCVVTGSKLEKVISKKKVINKYFEYFKLVVTSGTPMSAIIDGKVSILNTQVRGMRALIRNKKEELTL